MKDMFKNLEKGNMYISERDPEPNENGVFGIDIDLSGIESYLTVWSADKQPNESESELASFICFAFNLQQKYDISLFEEAIKTLEGIKSMCDGNVTKENSIWFECNHILNKLKQNK